MKQKIYKCVLILNSDITYHLVIFQTPPLVFFHKIQYFKFPVHAVNKMKKNRNLLRESLILTKQWNNGTEHGTSDTYCEDYLKYSSDLCKHCLCFLFPIYDPRLGYFSSY